MPATVWVTLIRKTLNMSLRQLGDRLAITPQSVRGIEKREKQGTISLKALREALLNWPKKSKGKCLKIYGIDGTKIRFEVRQIVGLMEREVTSVPDNEHK